MKIYNERIKGLREDKDKTQQELAEYLHVAQNTYSQYENGKREIPIEILIALCKFYNVSSDYILGISSQKDNRQK
ncbi:MAG: helix-turn-helix domain-containing protein [Lachnospiraceae bacterium]